MRWASAVSDAPSFTEAVEQACEQVIVALEGAAPDLILAFISAHHAPSYYSAPELLAARLGDAPVLGCSAAGVIGGGHEVERRPGVAVAAASLPDVRITPFELQQDTMPTPDAPPGEWEKAIGVSAADEPDILVLPDPFTMRVESFLTGLDYAFPSACKIGGLASGGARSGANALLIGDRVRRSGTVGVALTGNVKLDTVVAQGCRPIGRPFVVTECDRNVIRRLGNDTPLNVLREMFENAESREKRLIRRSLQIGMLMDPLTDSFTAGDFLIRNVIGADEHDGSVAVGELMQEGRVVQFHVRDAEAADQDLRAELEDYQASRNGTSPATALLFTCLGRGQYLFGAPDHDTNMFLSMVAPVPMTGFFCNGEIGPVGGSTFLHGYTSSFAVISPRKAAGTN